MTFSNQDTNFDMIVCVFSRSFLVFLCRILHQPCQVCNCGCIYHGFAVHFGHYNEVRATPFPMFCAQSAACLHLGLRPIFSLRSEALLSIIPSIDFDNSCFGAFGSLIMWQRKLIVGIKLLVFLLTCALAILSSFFSYSIRSNCCVIMQICQFFDDFCSPVALAITFILCTAIRFVSSASYRN
jgi:hypothetical protein